VFLRAGGEGCEGSCVRIVVESWDIASGKTVEVDSSQK
jgi:hypothetical protein